MNKIYKTIHRLFSGEVVVVPELAKNPGKSGSTLIRQSFIITDRAHQHTDNHSRNSLAIGISALLFTLSTNTFSQTLPVMIYDGTQTLDDAGPNGLNLPAWTNLLSSSSGLIYKNNNDIANTAANLEINYPEGDTPQFVIGGYSNIGRTVHQNTVTLTEGKVDGPVYGGLWHITPTTNSINKSEEAINSGNEAVTSPELGSLYANTNQNQINIKSNVQVTGNLYGGNATLWVQTGKASAGKAKNFGGDYAFANAYADAYANTDGLSIYATNNILTIGNQVNVSQGIYGGYAHIKAQSADAKVATANTDNNNTTAFASHAFFARADAHANADATANSTTISAKNNTVTVGSDATVRESIYGGYAHLNMQSAKATADGAIAIATSANSDAMVQAFAYATANASANSSTISAENNAVTVGNDTTVSKNIYGGYAQLTAIAGSAKGGIANRFSDNATATNRCI